MRLLRRLADRCDPCSLSARFRKTRGLHLQALLRTLPRPLTILDLGGEAVFWNSLTLDDQIHVVLVNATPQSTSSARFAALTGDARDLHQFADRSFELVVSNSVIEHVGTAADQQAMAGEIRRVARRYYVQTPNFWFPLDPHFLFPAFQFLPRRIQVWLLRRMDIGWLTRTPDAGQADAQIESIRLLSASDLRRLFPEAGLWREKFLGLTKSLVAFYGWDESKARNLSGSETGS